MRLKVCGVTDPVTCAMLEKQGVDWVGLWYKLPRGKHNLTERELAHVLSGLTHQPHSTRPVLVTLSASPDWLFPLLHAYSLDAVQLHGFQLPADIKRLKEYSRPLTLFKTLHIQAEQCLEERLMTAYIDAGIDAFIVDTFHSRQAIGSTGTRYNYQILNTLNATYPHLKWYCAGGVTADYLPVLRAQLPFLEGVDVDSAARVDGKIDPIAVEKIVVGCQRYTERQAA